MISSVFISISVYPQMKVEVGFIGIKIKTA